MKSYLDVANSRVLLLLVIVPICLVLVQSFLFARLSIKRMRELGLGGQVKKVIINSSIFSVVPSLPIVITMAALMVMLGRYLPWLRLSVIGSAMYETLCADMTLKGFGYAWGDKTFSSDVFVSVVWVMTCAALSWPLCNLIGLRFYDKRLKSMQKTGGFMKQATVAMFIGLMCYFSVPRFFNFKNPVGILVCVVSGGSVLLYDWLAKKTAVRVLSDFAFPLAMITGMAAAIIYTQIAGGA